MDNPKSPNPVDVEVGSKIRSRRLMLGLSQTQLAEGLGITFQQVQKYEKGKNRVGASRLQAISNILAVPPSYFFTPEGGTRRTGSDPHESQFTGADELMITKESLTLNRAFLRIEDANTRKKIIDLVRTLAESG